MKMRIVVNAAAIAVVSSLVSLTSALCQASPQLVAPAYSDFFSLARSGQLDLTPFGGAFGSDKYGSTQQGIEADQSVTPYIGIAGRATGYQLYVGHGFDSPLDPGTGYHSRLNFARLQGGLEIEPYPLTHLYILGGGDAGDSHAGVIEADFSSWLSTYSRHPLNISFSASHDSENGVTNSEIDVRAVALSKEAYMVFVGAGGAMFGGGFVSGLQGHGGPAVGVYIRGFQAGLDLQGGYGTPGPFVQINLFKLVSLHE